MGYGYVFSSNWEIFGYWFFSFSSSFSHSFFLFLLWPRQWVGISIQSKDWITLPIGILSARLHWMIKDVHIWPMARNVLNYAHSLTWNNNLAWLVESFNNTVAIKGFAALALDASNNPHLCCISNGCLIYTYKKGENWTFRTIDDSQNTGISISISMALDSQGLVHISYYDCKQKRLIYVSFSDNENESTSSDNENGSTSVNEGVNHEGVNQGVNEHAHEIIAKQIVDDSEEAGTENSLAMDLSGNVHIAYYDKAQQDLKYACKKRGGGWSIEVVDSTGNVGYSPALAVDRDGHPCISYSDWTNRHLKYAHRSNQGWITETVDNSLDTTGEFTSIALDHAGKPHISYFNRSAHALMYAVHNGKAWKTQLVNKNEDIDGSTSLALNSSGQVHIIYYNYTTNSLKYVISQDAPQQSPKDNTGTNKGYGCFLSAINIL